MPTSRPLSALVLVGGRSRRMGEDKAALDFLGEPLVLRTLRILAPLVGERIVVRRPGQDLPSLPPDVLVLEDKVAYQGPLGGLSAAFAAHPNARFGVFGCDLPLLAAPLVAFLRDLPGDFDAVVPVFGSRDQPLHAIWGAAAAPAIDTALLGGRRSVTALLDSLRVRRVAEAEWRPLDPEGRSFLNANRPEDLRLAEALANGNPTA